MGISVGVGIGLKINPKVITMQTAQQRIDHAAGLIRRCVEAKRETIAHYDKMTAECMGFLINAVALQVEQDMLGPKAAGEALIAAMTSTPVELDPCVWQAVNRFRRLIIDENCTPGQTADSMRRIAKTIAP